MTALPSGHKLFMGQHMRLVERTWPVTLGEFCLAWLLSGSTGERQVSQDSGSHRAHNASGSLCRNLVLFAARPGIGRQTNKLKGTSELCGLTEAQPRKGLT